MRVYSLLPVLGRLCWSHVGTTTLIPHMFCFFFFLSLLPKISEILFFFLFPFPLSKAIQYRAERHLEKGLPIWLAKVFLELRNKHKNNQIKKRTIQKSVLDAFCPPMPRNTAKANSVYPKKKETNNCSLQCQALGLEKARAVSIASTIPAFPGGICWCQSNKKKIKV